MKDPGQGILQCAPANLDIHVYIMEYVPEYMHIYSGVFAAAESMCACVRMVYTSVMHTCLHLA